MRPVWRDLPGTEQLAFERFGLSLLDTWIHVKLPWLPCKQNRDRVVCKIKDVPKRSFGKGTKSQTSLGWKRDHNREKWKFLVPIMGDQTREWKNSHWSKVQVWRPNWAWGIKRSRKFWLASYNTRGAYAFISVWNIWIRWFIGFSCSAIVVIIIGDPSAQIFRWTSHFSGNIDKFKNIFVSLNTVVIKYQKLLIYLVSFKYLKHLYHFATMVTGCVAISQRKD